MSYQIHFKGSKRIFTFTPMDRYALLIAPSKELLGWVNNIFPDDPLQFEEIQGHDSKDVFLIDEFGSTLEAEEWLQENFLMFLENTLFSWVENEDLWPKELNWETFQRFIDYEIHSVVYDVASFQDLDEDQLFFSPN